MAGAEGLEPPSALPPQFWRLLLYRLSYAPVECCPGVAPGFTELQSAA